METNTINIKLAQSDGQSCGFHVYLFIFFFLNDSAKIPEHCIWQDEKEFILVVSINPQNSRVCVNCRKNALRDNLFSPNK